MLGTFQQSQLRIEVAASEQTIRDCLLRPDQFRRWMFPQKISMGLPEYLQPGSTFTSSLGPIAVQHKVEAVDDHQIRLLLSQGVDGFHQWTWGDGWIQSCLEGVSLLPLNLGQTLSLLRLKAFLTQS